MSLLTCSVGDDSRGDVGIVSLNFSDHPSYRTPGLMSLEHSKLEVHCFVVQPDPPPEMDPDCPGSPHELLCQGK